MKSIIKDTRLIILFFIVILVVPVFWTTRINKEPGRSLVEYRTLAAFPVFPMADMKTAAKRLVTGKPLEAWTILKANYSDGVYQAQLEKALSDQFPLRSPAVQLAYGLDRVLIRLGYAFVDTKAIPADMKSGVYETRKTKVLFVRPKSFTDEQKGQIEEQVARYHNLVKQNQDLNFYIFHIELLDFSKHNPFSPGNPNADTGKSVEYFKSRLPEGITFEVFPLNSFEDHMKYYYHTDHHWNIHGSLLGYEQVYRMLKINYPNISPMVAHDTIYKFPDVKFHGSWARYALYPMRPGDDFEVALLDLPPYQILDETGQPFKYNKMNDYLSGAYSRKPFTDHYVEYYGGGSALHEYVFENGADRNILVVGDSYSFALENLIASHYHHSYFVDLRNYTDRQFSLSEFRSNHDIDDILILGVNFTTLNQSRWSINP